MTSKERVRLAFEHKEADRVPVGEMHIMPHVSSEILGREAITGEGRMYYQMAQLVSQGRRDEFVQRIADDSLELVSTVGHDLILTELDPSRDPAYKVTEISETGWTEVDKETGHWRRFVYEQDKEMTMEIDSTEKQEGISGVVAHLEALEKSGFRIDSSCFDSTREVCRKAKEELFCMAKIPNLIPSGRSWYTFFMELAITEPDLTKRLCDAYTKYALEAAKGYVECGVDGVMIATDWAMNTGPLFPPSFIEEYMIPQVNAVADYCHQHDVVVMKHSDGNIMPIADLFFGMRIDAYQSIEPYAGMNLGEIKKKYGDKITLMGNVDCGRTLPFGTKEEIIEETKECIKQGAPGGGYILSSSNTISYPISADAMLTMVETVRKHGIYPISIK